jgi:hypothetical protein
MFRFCYSLKSVTIPDGVASIGPDGFQSCSSLTSISIPNSVTNIGGSAFYRCTGLTEVTVGAKVARIGPYAFTGCTNLRAVYFLGDAPAADSGTFNGSPLVTIYYLPGTIGWGPTFGGRPTKLWKPRIQAGDTSFGVRTNQFGFNIAWASGRTVLVDACTNLANPLWSPMSTNILSDGASYFTDPNWSNYSARFYRVRWP